MASEFIMQRQTRAIALLSALCLILPLSLDAFQSPAITLLVPSRKLTSPIHLHVNPSQRKCLPLAMGSLQMPHANLAVSIDQPLLPSIPRSLFMTSVLKILVSDIFKAAVAAFLVTFSVSVLARTPSFQLQATNVWNLIKGQANRIWEMIRPGREGVPMTFNEDENEGWGVCTLRSKKKFGRTSFMRYDFDLPNPDNVLALKLGQKVNFCCLDEKGGVAKGEFYAYQSGTGRNQNLGSLSILAPERTVEDTQFAIGADSAKFIQVLKYDMKIGDEVAVRPGAEMLEYQGSHLPVTVMVYIAFGVGIVPILDQLRAVLPHGSSSVKDVTVVYINDDTLDFDQTEQQLEKEYLKYSTKLSVTCAVDNLRENSLADNGSVNSAVPSFAQGTMAVLSVPKEVVRMALMYLKKRGYPEDCICVL